MNAYISNAFERDEIPLGQSQKHLNLEFCYKQSNLRQLTSQATLNMAAPRTSLRAAYTKHILNQHLLTKLNDATGLHHETLPVAPELRDDLQDKTPYQGRICIIGAGVAGLYLAMMLKSLGITNVDILEGSNRVGGRCYTQSLDDNANPHNYYDFGAMRIPSIPWMQQ